MFIDLHSSRGSNGFGINPISYQEIKAYSDLYSLPLDIWEIELIKGIDRVYMKVQSEESERKSKSKK